MSSFTGFLRRRWPAVALVVSLVLNGFFVGMFVTDQLKDHRHSLSGARFARFELRRFDDRLPKEAVDQIAAAVSPLAPELDRHLMKLREIRAEILRIAAEPTPDRAALDAQLAAARAETAAMQDMVQRATYDALLGLAAEDRARLAAPPGKS